MQSCGNHFYAEPIPDLSSGGSGRSWYEGKKAGLGVRPGFTDRFAN